MGIERLDRDAAERDLSVFEEIFVLFAPALLAYARRRFPTWARRRAEPEDLVQDALVALWSRREWIDTVTPRTLRAYLFTSVRNRIRDELRRAQLLEVVGLESPDLMAGKLTRETHHARREGALLARRALRSLSMRDRKLVVGRLILGLSFRDLARMGCAPNANAARQALLRALRRARKRLAGPTAPERPSR